MKEILYFTSTWCVKCKSVTPVMEQLREEGININKIDVDNNPEDTKTLGVRGIPAMILFNGGVEVSRLSGVQSKEDILNWYNG